MRRRLEHNHRTGKDDMDVEEVDVEDRNVSMGGGHWEVEDWGGDHWDVGAKGKGKYGN